MLYSICQKVLFVKSKGVLYHQSTGKSIALSLSCYHFFLESKKLQKWHNEDSVDQARVVQNVDGAIHQINLYPVE